MQLLPSWALALLCLLAASPAHAQSAMDIFNRFDGDGDGLVHITDLPDRIAARAVTIDTDDDGIVSRDEVELWQQHRSASAGNDDGNAEPATLRDQRYSDRYERSTMDIWLAQSDAPSPIIVYFHGGGFSGGNKSSIRLSEEFLTLPSQGIAFASVGYPLERDINASGEWGHLPIIFDESAAALSYLRANAARLGIDPARVVLAGSSAGTVISQHLAYVQEEPVEGVIAIQQPRAVELIEPHLRAGAPPMFFYTLSAPTDNGHHPDLARQLHAACQTVGQQCHLFGSQRSGLASLPGGDGIVAFALEELGF